MLARANVSIRTLELAEAADFGILRLIVSDPRVVKALLNERGINAKIVPVIAIEIADEVGCFSRVIAALTAEGIDIAYTYTVHNGTRGIFVIKTAEGEIASAIDCLEREGIKVLDAV